MTFGSPLTLIASVSALSFLLFADELNTFGLNSLALISSSASEIIRLSKNSMPASKFGFAAGGGVGVLIERILSMYDEDGFFFCGLSDEEDRCVFFDLLEFELVLLLLLLRLDEADELVERLDRRFRCDGDRESRLLCRVLLYFDDDDALYRVVDDSDELSERWRYFDDFRSDERCRPFFECFDRDDDRRRVLFCDEVRERDLPIVSK